TVARNSDKIVDALRESEGRGQVSVRLADGTVINVSGVRMDLAVKFEDFDSTELFLVLDMDKYDLIPGMPWLEKHEPWIDCSNTESRRALWASTVTVPKGTDQAGNIGPQAAEAAEEDAEGVSGVGNIVPRKNEETNMRAEDFLVELKAREIAEMVLPKPETSPEDLNSSSVMDEDVPEGFTKQHATRLGSENLKNPEDPVYPLVKEFSDVVSKHPPWVSNPPPFQLPPGRGVRHEIDLVPGTKYSVTRQWPLPREQCEVIDAFFAEKAKSGMVQGSKSPHSMPTFCVRKPNGKWRLVHAYNKINDATVPAQTPVPRKDVLLNNMSSCTLYSTLDLGDGYYQILMRESDIPLSVVSTPSGMRWEWLVMPHRLSNAPVTFNRLVTQ
ncbi:RNA-directed DNA polymerase, partial [Phytophthora palmivora]